MLETSVNVIVTASDDGDKYYITVLPTDVVFSKGMISECILGVLHRALAAGESITPDIFTVNPVFVKFLHEIIARYGAEDEGCQNEAKRLGTGWVYVLDGRTKTPRGTVPSQDILGAFEAKDGQLLPDRYRFSPNHKILTEDGFFRLSPKLYRLLLKELQLRLAQKREQ
ncbi:hypothetical protein BH10PLA1_BH10PLA1_08120 [soil metagenome]